MGAGTVAKFFRYCQESGLWPTGKESTERSMIKFYFLIREINALDNMLNMLEQHSEQLEEVLEEKSSELQCERQKCDVLLLSRLPRYDICSERQHFPFHP